MGFFDRLKGVFSKKYTPIEALEYLRTKSAWFSQQNHLLQGKLPQFKNVFLSLIPSNTRSLTESDIQDYAKKALARVTIARTLERSKAKKGALAIGMAKRSELDKERRRFSANMQAAFDRQDKNVQRAIQECKLVVQGNKTANNPQVKQAAAKVKNEVRSLEHDLVRAIRKNRGLSSEEAAILRDSLKQQISIFEEKLNDLDKWVVYHLSKVDNQNARERLIEMLERLDNQITLSAQEFAAIERVQFDIYLKSVSKKSKSAA